VREAIFDVLGSALPEGIRGRAADLFAGTGALGIEALSRGAAGAIFIEQDPTAVRVLRENVRRSGFEDRATVLAAPVRRAVLAMDPAREPVFDLVFLDPPYGQGLSHDLAALLAARGLLAPGAVVVMELGRGDPDGDPPGLASFRSKRYGDTRVAFLRPSIERLAPDEPLKSARAPKAHETSRE
jgi:16S rRNA (guanine966-N2)-methyltransferase